MNEEFSDMISYLPDYLGWHILLSLAALGVGLIVSIPLGILASRRPKLAEYLLGGAGVLQTVPTMAMLVLMVPLLGGTIGFAPAFVALTLYSILPILANTVTGIRGIDPTLTEAARGLGMNDWQMLTRVQLPLAAPVIIAGIRTATVLIVGTATLATPVGGMSLGNYIFSGLEMSDRQLTLFGCIVAALLAVGLDQIVHLLELAAIRRSGRLAWCAVVGVVLVLLGGLYGPITRAFSSGAPVIANAPFTEQFILSEVIKDKLQKAGFREVDQRGGMGETIQFLALKHDQIDCCINYTGNVWATLMKRKDVVDREKTYAEVVQFLCEEYGVECLGKIGFENAYALTMLKKTADAKGIKSIDDLAKHPDFKIAGDLQFFHRNEWRQIRKNYDLRLRAVEMNPSFLHNSLKDASVEVICAYSSDGRFLGQELLTLSDPKQALPPYDAILLLSRKGAQNARLRTALLPLVQAVNDRAMQQANLRVDVEEQSPRRAARELLLSLARK
ncbi:MAG: ABC transporter permease subunit [Gemmataceae bacterium]|nr:ABC transporter permease subunit [Gemmataceae bacterium]